MLGFLLTAVNVLPYVLNLLLIDLKCFSFTYNYTLLHNISFNWTSNPLFATFFLSLLLLTITFQSTACNEPTPRLVWLLLPVYYLNYSQSNFNFSSLSFSYRCTLVNNLLMVSLYLVHPFVFYLSFSLATVFLITELANLPYRRGSWGYGTSRLITTLRLSVLSVALGSWWAFQEGDWGGWWFWDPSEVFSLWLFLYTYKVLHRNRFSRYEGCYVHLSLLASLLTCYVFLQLNFKLTSHTFVQPESVLGFKILLLLLLTSKQQHWLCYSNSQISALVVNQTSLVVQLFFLIFTFILFKDLVIYTLPKIEQSPLASLNSNLVAGLKYLALLALVYTSKIRFSLNMALVVEVYQHFNFLFSRGYVSHLHLLLYAFLIYTYTLADTYFILATKDSCTDFHSSCSIGSLSEWLFTRGNSGLGWSFMYNKLLNFKPYNTFTAEYFDVISWYSYNLKCSYTAFIYYNNNIFFLGILATAYHSMLQLLSTAFVKLTFKF